MTAIARAVASPDATARLDTAIARITAALGPKGVLTDPDAIAPHLVEWRDLYQGASRLVARPANTAEVAEVVKICAELGQPIVPQGGNTGLCGGQTPSANGEEIVLSLSRMDRIRALDADNATITCEAGVTQQRVHEAAAEAGLMYPLTIGSKGTCQVGGNLSTNAGGVQVLKYGNARDLCLGLEVVLPDGRIWEGLKGLRKDNTGYDLKHMFIGAEGTLGVVTAAVLKLFPRPRALETAIVAVNSPADAVALLGATRAATGDQVTAFEILPRIGIEFVTRWNDSARDPLAEAHPWYVLIEVSGGQEPARLRDLVESALGEAMEAGLVRDAALAESEAQRAAFWMLREYLSECQKFEGGSIKHDVSVPVSRIADFIARANDIAAGVAPECRPVPFGHIGDGNIHYNVSQPIGADKTEFLGRWHEMNERVHDLVHELGGSISAEHGLGQLKRDEVLRYKSDIEMDMMRRIKAALDPHGLMNPGKVL